MTIKEVSDKYQLSTDTLRYYEKVGLIGPISKNKSGIRDYKETDLRTIEFVKCMRQANMPIDKLIRYMNLYKEGNKTHEDRKQLLVEQVHKVEKEIQELEKAKERLCYKIDLYDHQLLEKNLSMEKETVL